MASGRLRRASSRCESRSSPRARLDRRPRASSAAGSAGSAAARRRRRGRRQLAWRTPASSARRLGGQKSPPRLWTSISPTRGDMEPHVFPYSQTQQQSARGGVRRPPSPRGRLATEVDGGGDGEADGGAELHQALLELLGVAQRELIGRRLETPAAAARAAAARARVRGGRRLTRRRTTAASRRAYAWGARGGV